MFLNKQPFSSSMASWKLIALLILILASTPATLAFQERGYPFAMPYYSGQYFGPPRTGLPDSSYYYPGGYRLTNGWFEQYRSYTHSAYQIEPRLYLARPGPWNTPWRPRY